MLPLMFLKNTFQLEKPTDSYFDGLMIAVWIYGKNGGDTEERRIVWYVFAICLHVNCGPIAVTG